MIIGKAAKLHALATRGIDGEMENAKRMLTTYVAKHSGVLRHLYPNYYSAKPLPNIDDLELRAIAKSLSDIFTNKHGKVTCLTDAQIREMVRESIEVVARM